MYGNLDEVIEKFRTQLDSCLGEKEYKFTDITNEVEYDEKLSLGEYKLTIAGEVLASFKLYPMIGCCGICVSTQAFVNPSFRGRGLGTLMNSIRIDIARYNGYSLLLCTDIEKNEPQRKILKSNGWKDIHKFINKRTQNTIFISVINL